MVTYSHHLNWEERSDSQYAPTMRKSLVKLNSDHQVDTDQEEVPQDELQNQGDKDAPGNYQRTTITTPNRYRILKSNIVSESKHTIKLKSVCVLSKSAVTMKPKPAVTKKRKPATITEMVAGAKPGTP